MIFDRSIKWETNVKAMNWTALLSGNPNLQRYVPMQCIKGSSSARCSKKRGNRKEKPIPRIVFRFGRQDRQIKKFLETRRFILDSLKQMKKEMKRKVES